MHQILSIQVYSSKPNFYKKERCITHTKEFYAMCCENCFELACSKCNNSVCATKVNKKSRNFHLRNYSTGMSVPLPIRNSSKISSTLWPTIMLCPCQTLRCLTHFIWWKLARLVHRWVPGRLYALICLLWRWWGNYWYPLPQRAKEPST